MVALASPKQSPKTPLSIERKHKLEKHICDVVDIKGNKEIDLYKTHLEIGTL